ncbi:MAG TPA: hypothetical protein VMF11_02115 [Candidatus Baltobacteraceae bacterium]|nr:hypothetical protein [Candidatus Baltobacteraceae bacterium]
MNVRLIAGTIGIAAALAACGGGGNGGTVPPPIGTPSATPGVTNASGTLVNDANGSPLAGVTVKLMPWAPCGPTPSPATSITPENDGCPTPLPSPQVTTAPNGTFALNNVPNGHYLLVIGADAVASVPPGYTTPPGSCGGPCPSPSPVSFTVQATVHDNVTLTGGNQTLAAPTLPTVPSGYTAPSWETNGDYRLATLDATTEMPCYIAWQYERTQNDLAGSSIDEWLLENVRANNAYAQVATVGASTYPISTGAINSSGGTSCAGYINSTTLSQMNYAADPRAIWFAGQYLPFGYNGNVSVSAMGFAELTIDPRSYTDPNHPTWP